MKISWRSYSLPLKVPFRISKGTFHERRALIIKLEEQGEFGLGEATEITYYDKSIAGMTGVLEEVQESISLTPFLTPELFFEAIHPLVSVEPFVLSAIDCAAYDLYGKLHDLPTAHILKIPSDATYPPT
ncbi:MAG: hypothetical protein OEQ53_20015, partial [Saprospiraceae bacterium]|nr:hypothetical protein [Saprospiraceae bacterium]